MKIANLAGRLTLMRSEDVVDVETASEGRFDHDPGAVYERWDEFVAWASGYDGPGTGTGYDESRLGAPSPRPRQAFGVGVNYADHVAETGSTPPDRPVIFPKFTSCIVGQSETVLLGGGNIDWEAELVVVIGRLARHVSEDAGWDHVAGLTVGQDVSNRNLQLEGAPPSQYGLGKSQRTFGPTGPWLVTPDELENPRSLGLECRLNDEVVQSSNTRHLIFDVAYLVAYLSRYVDLLPGDLIFTGTPSGVGMGRTPARYLAATDRLSTTIDGVGTLTTRFADDPILATA
jgi:2-keto-4-pentenoate hydratase/2-oxohepta-3-ene-1,7-dioic acid hydratase in catechol pathway